MENERIDMENEMSRGAPPPADKPAIPVSEAAFAWASLALGFVFTHFAARYFGGVWGGIFWALFGITGAAFVKMKSVEIRISHIVIFGVAELFCLVPLFSANRFVCFLAGTFSFMLYLYLITAVSGAELFGRHFVRDMLLGLLLRPFENFPRQPICAFSVFKDRSRSRNALYALLGLLIAVPLTAVAAVLLIRSDELFASSVDGFFGLLPKLSFSALWEPLFAVPIAMYLFGAWYSAGKPVRGYLDDAPSYRVLPPLVAYFAVTPVCMFYLVYIVTQFRNVASALDRTLDYSKFARNGFFELCAIAVINLGVIALMQTFARRKENDVKPVPLRVYTIMISLFTLLIIATAMTKMMMYVGEYGMTPLRVYTSWFMALLALTFAVVIALQIRDFVVWRPLFAVFAAMLALLCFGDFEGMIARYNISAYQAGALSELDTRALAALGCSAAAPVAELLESSTDERLNAELRDVLEDARRRDEYDGGFAYFSIPRAKARAAMKRVKGL